MRILALIGPSSCGKTTTLNLVYDSIIAKGGGSTNRQPQGGNPHDFSDIVRWNGRSIAFFTMGDFSKPLMDAIRDFDIQRCDVLVCACNSKLVKPPRLIATFQHTIFNKVPERNAQLRGAADSLVAQTIENNI